jgi:glycosyltransferase involved in cell wall biosynthesis
MKTLPGIIAVINSLEPGGAEIFVLRLMKYLKEDFRCFVITPMGKNNDSDFASYFFSQTESTHLPMYSGLSEKQTFIFWKCNAILKIFGISDVFNKLSLWHQKRYWRKVIAKNNIKLVNSHFFTSELFVLRQLKSAVPKLPWCITMHSSFNAEVYTNFSQEVRENFFASTRQIMTSADHVFCVADRNKELIEVLGINRQIEKVYLGYDSTVVASSIDSPFPKDHVVFSMIGRGVKEKGWHIALTAFEEIRKNYSNVGLLCIGPLTDYMKELQKEFKHVPDVHFTGYVKDTSPFISFTNVGLLPSYGESLPYSVIEFLGQGCPIIVSNRGEMPIMIETPEGFAGATIIDGDDGMPDINCLKKLMESYLVDPNLLDKQSKFAEIAFKKFSIHECGERYRQVFQQLMNAKR